MRKGIATVVYDLRVLPATFDFLAYLAMVDGIVRKNTKEFAISFNVILVYGESLRGDEFKNVSSQDEYVKSRIHKVIFPQANLLPFVNSYRFTRRSSCCIARSYRWSLSRFVPGTGLAQCGFPCEPPYYPRSTQL